MAYSKWASPSCPVPASNSSFHLSSISKRGPAQDPRHAIMMPFRLDLMSGSGFADLLFEEALCRLDHMALDIVSAPAAAHSLGYGALCYCLNIAIVPETFETLPNVSTLVCYNEEFLVVLRRS